MRPIKNFTKIQSVNHDELLSYFRLVFLNRLGVNDRLFRTQKDYLNYCGVVGEDYYLNLNKTRILLNLPPNGIEKKSPEEYSDWIRTNWKIDSRFKNYESKWLTHFNHYDLYYEEDIHLYF